MPHRCLFLARAFNSNGITTHMVTLAEGLVARGWDVAVAKKGLRDIEMYDSEDLEKRGIASFYVPFPLINPKPSSIKSAIQSFYLLEKVVHFFNPDIIHVHYRATSPYAHLIQKRYSIPFVSTMHAIGLPVGRMSRAGSFWGDCAIAVSAETRDFLRDSFKVAPNKIEIVHNGVDSGHFRLPTQSERVEARQTFGLSQNEKVVCLVGRLEADKGHDILIRSLATLRSQGVDVVALFAGVGKRADAIMKNAAEAGVADLVRMLGYADSRKVLWASDMFALPSINEGFPLVIIEAMLCGVPCLRTPAAGASEQIIDGVDGFIVPFDDHRALALKIRQLFENPDLKARISQVALSKAQQSFTSDKMIERTIQVYERVLGT